MQDIAWYLTLILMGLLGLVFLMTILSSTKQEAYEEVARRDYSYRGKIFWLVIVAGVFITVGTLLPWPHTASANLSADRVVQAVGSQWQWELSENRFDVGETVEFEVTSKDVNHGFGIYDADMTMVAQIQAMPGYTNKLQYTFDKPGEYTIMCMEYCGLAHHSMMATINVAPTNQ